MLANTDRLRAAIAVRLELDSADTGLSAEEPIRVAYDHNGELWFATVSESQPRLLILTQKTEISQDIEQVENPISRYVLERYPLEKVQVNVLATVDGALWVGTQNGLIIIRDKEANPWQHWLSQRYPGPITAIMPMSDNVWVGGQNGLFLVSRNTTQNSGTREPGKLEDLRPILEHRVNSLSRVNERIFVSTELNAYPLSDLGIGDPLVIEESHNVSMVRSSSRRLWVLTQVGKNDHPGPCIIIEGNASHTLEGVDMVTSVESVEKDTWLGTERGVVRITYDQLKNGGLILSVLRDMLILEQIEGIVDTIKLIDSRVFIATRQRAYLTDVVGSEVEPIPLHGTNLSIKGFTKSADSIWLWSGTGLYLFDDRTEITTELSSGKTLPLIQTHLLFSHSLRIHANYDQQGFDPYGSFVLKRFNFQYLRYGEDTVRDAVDTRSNKSDTRIVEEPSVDIDYEQQIPWGFHKAMVIVQDDFGNSVDLRLSILAVPPLFVWILFLSWGFVGIFGLFVAPYSDTVLKFITGSVTGFLALGFIGFATKVGFLRRRILRRYVEDVISSDEYCGWEIEAARPRIPNNLDSILAQGSVSLNGTSEDATYALLYLTRRYCKKNFGHKVRLLNKLIPIYLGKKKQDDEWSSGHAIEELAAKKLMYHGLIQSERLAVAILRRGHYVFLIDSNKELTERERNALSAFIALHASSRGIRGILSIRCNSRFIVDKGRIGMPGTLNAPDIPLRKKNGRATQGDGGMERDDDVGIEPGCDSSRHEEYQRMLIDELMKLPVCAKPDGLSDLLDDIPQAGALNRDHTNAQLDLRLIVRQLEKLGPLAGGESPLIKFIENAEGYAKGFEIQNRLKVIKEKLIEEKLTEK